MNFLNIGAGELMAILAIAILVIGPKRMLTVARSLGRVVRKMQGISKEFMGNLQQELAETEQETRQFIEGVAQESEDISDEVQTAEEETDQALARGAQETKTLQEEIVTFGQEAQQALGDVADGFTSTVMGESAPQDDSKETEDGEEKDA